MKRAVPSTVVAALIWSFAPPAIAQTVPPYVTAAVNDAHRPAVDTMRDAARKPAESLAFAGVKPGDKVVDFIAGGGYFTRILSKVVGPQGHVYATAPGVARPMGGMGQGGMPMGNMPQSSMPMGGMAQNAMGQGGNMPMGGMGGAAELAAIASDPAYSNVTALTQPTSKIMAPEAVDVVWTAQNYHDLHNPGALHADDMAAFNKSVFDALKPGGLFVVIDYAAAPGAGFMQSATLHRAEAEAEKTEILKAGFVFDGESTILANPNDPHTMRAHEQDDQFLLRFRKPR